MHAMLHARISMNGEARWRPTDEGFPQTHVIEVRLQSGECRIGQWVPAKDKWLIDQTLRSPEDVTDWRPLPIRL